MFKQIKKTQQSSLAAPPVVANATFAREQGEHPLLGSHQESSSVLTILDNVSALIWAIDLEFRFTFFNQIFAEFYLYRFKHLPVISESAFGNLGEAEAKEWRDRYQNVLDSGPLFFESTWSESRVVEIQMQRVVREGQIIGVMGFLIDITERKNLERERKAAEQRFHDLFTSTVEGIFQTSVDGVVRTANPAMLHLLGYDSLEDYRAQVKYVATDLWADERARTRMLELLRHEDFVRGFETQFKRKDGSLIWIKLCARNVRGSNGEILYLEGYLEDISNRKLTEDHLKSSEERYRQTFEQAAVGFVHSEFNGRILRCNQKFCEILGYSREELQEITRQQFVYPEDLQAFTDISSRLFAGRSLSEELEIRYVRKDGSIRWVSCCASVQRDADWNPVHLITTVIDIDVRKHSEKRLAVAIEKQRVSEERYRTAFQVSLDAIAISRREDGVYVECNKAFTDISGYSLDELIGHSSLDVNIWKDVEDRKRMVEAVTNGTVFRNREIQFRKKNGECFWGMMSASKIELDGVPCLLSITRDISDLRLAADEIRSLAYYDPLTGLPNRRLLLENLQSMLALSRIDKRNRALLFIDLDNFKTLNDTLGHQTGDELLQNVAQRIRQCSRGEDMVARLGGDEFVVLIAQLSDDVTLASVEARMLSERIIDSVNMPYILSGRECLITCSIGVAVFSDQVEKSSDLLQKADLAMYKAKSAGRNTMCFFAPELQDAVNERATLEDELRQAIRAQQFTLHYQPQVYRGRIVGAEALLRWNHPHRGLLTPGNFIQLAEETGLILAIGDWVLNEACEKIAEWEKHEETCHLTLSINISVRQFKQPEFVEHVLYALERTGSNPRKLKLELTESMLLENIEDVIVKMMTLRQHGLCFSLDDFGTGYSSLAYLQRLPLDQLKIDQSFVRNIEHEMANSAISQAIISLGRAMNLPVIAEGVETESQRNHLALLGCYYYQGFLFGRPVSSDEFMRAQVQKSTPIVSDSILR